jgi:uncharacterized protein YoxC
MLLTISVTVIAAVMVIVLIALIPVLLQVRRTAREAERILEMIRMQVVPLSHDVTILSQQFHGILRSVHRQIDDVEEGVASLRDAAARLREFEETTLRRVELPVRNLAALVRGVGKGVETFFRVLSR